MQNRIGRRAYVAVLLMTLVGTGMVGCTALTAAEPHSDPQIPLPSPAPPAPSPSRADPMGEGRAMPTPSPGATVDAAARAKAAAWLAGARMPPAAVKVAYPPSGTTIDDESQGWWCRPMAEVDAYWRVPGMDLNRVSNWLRVHPSNGLKIIGPTHVAPDPNVTNDAVYDFPSPMAFEGMTFGLASWGQKSAVIHLQIGVLGKSSVCATPGPGAELGTAGG